MTDYEQAREPEVIDRGARLACGYAGHTLIELTVVITLSSIVVAAIHSALIAQHRFYLAQSQIVDARTAARVAVQVLAGELRGLSPAAGDLYAIGPDSVALRAAVGLGVVCAASGTELVLWQTSGVFGNSRTDSVHVFVEGFAGSQGDSWLAARVKAVRSAGPADCAGPHRAELRLTLDRALQGLTVGSPVRAFRPYVYRLYPSRDGRWWLGQRLRYGRLQPIAGPFAPAGFGGLEIEYMTAEGAPTDDPRRVALVRISVTARSRRRVPRAGGADFFAARLSTVVYLRNS